MDPEQMLRVLEEHFEGIQKRIQDDRPGVLEYLKQLQLQLESETTRSNQLHLSGVIKALGCLLAGQMNKSTFLQKRASLRFDLSVARGAETSNESELDKIKEDLFTFGSLLLRLYIASKGEQCADYSKEEQVVDWARSMQTGDLGQLATEAVTHIAVAEIRAVLTDLEKQQQITAKRIHNCKRMRDEFEGLITPQQPEKPKKPQNAHSPKCLPNQFTVPPAEQQKQRRYAVHKRWKDAMQAATECSKLPGELGSIEVNGTTQIVFFPNITPRQFARLIQGNNSNTSHFPEILNSNTRRNTYNGWQGRWVE